MNMHWIDWTIIFCVILFVIQRALSTKKLARSVADFLAANRCAGRYLLSIALGEAGQAAASVIILFEIFYQSGFARFFWGALHIPISLFILLSGWVIYRFRQTRALTMAQFFEMRYSRRFRIFTGILAWFSGILNFGIFPGIGARFFINFCGFSPSLSIFGFYVSTYAIVLLILITLALFFNFIGGQITVIVTDFWQGFISTFIFVAVVIFIWIVMPWETMKEGLIIASEPGQSLIDPFDIASQPDFNFFFYVIMIILGLYGHMAWQGCSGYNSAALTPHEAKMSRVYGQLRGYMGQLGLMLIPIVAIVVMHHPSFTEEALLVNETLQNNYPEDEILQRQMLTPVVISRYFPVGLVGAFAAAMLGFFISTNNTYMHSWGSIFIQDVIYPMKKKTLTNRQHIWLLRMAILGVAVFSYFFSLLYPIKEYIMMYLQVTASIYLGGAGSVIIGGLYWKRGTTAGAWTGMIIGCFTAFTSIVLRQLWPNIDFLNQFSPEFPVNGVLMSFYSTLSAICGYLIVSLLTGKNHNVNMDKILRRGKYEVEEEKKIVDSRSDHHRIGRFWKMIGVNSREFSKIDRALFLYSFLFAAAELTGFFILVLFHLFGYMNNEKWLFWWRIRLVYFLVMGAVGCIWISAGGIFDLKKMYNKLTSYKRDESDDGRVIEDYSDNTD